MKDYIIALSSDDAKNLKEKGHFGDSKYFLIYSLTNTSYKFVKTIKNTKRTEDEDHIHGEEKKAIGIAQILSDVDILVSREFGPNIVKMLRKFPCVILRGNFNSTEEILNFLLENTHKIDENYNQGENRKALILKKD
jgi:predicted Fe-Mo cluster-binding NifX family protein